MTRSIMHLDADAFFASVEQGFNPLLRGKPVIVGGNADERGCVHTASYEARRKGIKTGMALRTAKKICPDAVFLKGNFRQYKAAGNTIREILERFSPYVEQPSLDDAYVDITGVRRYSEDPVLIGRAIKQAIYGKLHLTVSIGIATSKVVARIASGLQKPDGLTIVPPGKEREFLSSLPIGELPGVGHRTEQVLTDLGIATIGEIAALPKNVPVQLFGVNGEKIWRFARGEDSRSVEERKLAKQISRETSFAENTDDEQLIQGTIIYLMERITGKLRSSGWVARTVRVLVRYGNGGEEIRMQAMDFPADDTRTFIHQALYIYQQFPRRRAAVRFISLMVSEIDWKDRQGVLFTETTRSDQLNRGVDTIRCRFGFTAVAPAALLSLKSYYRMEKYGYVLHTPALSQ